MLPAGGTDGRTDGFSPPRGSRLRTPPARPPRSGHRPPWAGAARNGRLSAARNHPGPGGGAAAPAGWHPATAGIASAGGSGERGTAARPGAAGRAREPAAPGAGRGLRARSSAGSLGPASEGVSPPWPPPPAGSASRSLPREALRRLTATEAPRPPLTWPPPTPLPSLRLRGAGGPCCRPARCRGGKVGRGGERPLLLLLPLGVAAAAAAAGSRPGGCEGSGARLAAAGGPAGERARPAPGGAYFPSLFFNLILFFWRKGRLSRTPLPSGK